MHKKSISLIRSVKWARERNRENKEHKIDSKSLIVCCYLLVLQAHVEIFVCAGQISIVICCIIYRFTCIVHWLDIEWNI